MNCTKCLAIPCDAVLYSETGDQYRDWDASLNEDHMRALEEFVTTHIRDRGPARHVQSGVYQGSYNRVVRFTFDSVGGRDVALKFPKPGHSAGTLAAEKAANEAAWIEFLGENTSIPVPHVYSWGTEPGHLSTLKLPYILMDWMPGDNLRDFLASVPPKELISTIYQQIASFYLQLHRLSFQDIGSVVKDRKTGQWNIRRPLTIDMHQLVLDIANYPTDGWPVGRFTNAQEYVDFVLNQQSIQLWTLPNINAPYEHKNDGDCARSSEEIARLRYEARNRFKQLSNSPDLRLRDYLGPFRAFNPDLDTRNMTVDTLTGQILGVFDLEFTNAMPAEFACDPPLSLFRTLPGPALNAGFFPWFLREYEPLLKEFLDAMRREELKLESKPQTPLSTMMRNSWVTKRVWFNFALNQCDYVDAIYWAVLHDLHPGGVVPELPAGVKAEMERYAQETKFKMAEYQDSLDSYMRKAGQ